MTPEGKVKAAVKKVLQQWGAWFFMPVPTGRGVAGVPDIIACVPVKITIDMVGKTVGLFVAVETKAPGKEGTVTPLQQRQIDGIRAARGIAEVVSSADEAVRNLPVNHQQNRHELETT